MANCADLVNAVNLVGAYVIALTETVNALRQDVICLNETLKQAMPTREFYAEVQEKQQQVAAVQVSIINKGLNQIATAVAGQPVPETAAATFETIAASDLFPFVPCSSDFYCPPGYVKDESGNCVPIE